MAKVDSTDREILDWLRAHGRGKASALAKRLGISSGAVRKRIARLERDGVIAGYTAVINHEQVDRSIEAYVLLTLEGKDVQGILKREALEGNPQVREVSTLAGDPDALVRIRADDVSELRDVITKLREMSTVTSSKTLVALGRTRNVAELPAIEA